MRFPFPGAILGNGNSHDRISKHIHTEAVVNPMGYRHAIMHWCTSYPQYIINQHYIHKKGLYLVQQLFSEIKLRYAAALGWDKYPNRHLQVGHG